MCCLPPKELQTRSSVSSTSQPACWSTCPPSSLLSSLMSIRKRVPYGDAAAKPGPSASPSSVPVHADLRIPGSSCWAGRQQDEEGQRQSNHGAGLSLVPAGFWVEPLDIFHSCASDHSGLSPEKQVQLKSLLEKDTKEIKH